jgi:hypothetical protein
MEDILQFEEHTIFFCDSVILMKFYGKCNPIAGSVQLYHYMQPKKFNMNIRTCYTSINIYIGFYCQHDKSTK